MDWLKHFAGELKRQNAFAGVKETITGSLPQGQIVPATIDDLADDDFLARVSDLSLAAYVRQLGGGYGDDTRDFGVALAYGVFDEDEPRSLHVLHCELIDQGYLIRFLLAENDAMIHQLMDPNMTWDKIEAHRGSILPAQELVERVASAYAKIYSFMQRPMP